jgi:hypothetical protein
MEAGRAGRPSPGATGGVGRRVARVGPGPVGWLGPGGWALAPCVGARLALGSALVRTGYGLLGWSAFPLCLPCWGRQADYWRNSQGFFRLTL